MSAMTHPTTGQEMRPLQCDLCDRVRSRRVLEMRTVELKPVVACRARTNCRNIRRKAVTGS
jgi:hypothetical protein